MKGAEAGRDRTPYGALLSSNALSLCGTAMALVAIPWFVLEASGSAARTGAVTGLLALSNVAGALFGGPVADRMGLRRASVLADLAAAAAIAAVALLGAVSALGFGRLAVLVVIAGLAESFGVTARRALVPELAARARLDLERANSGTQSVQRLAMMLGAPMGGLLLAVFDAPAVLAVDAATFLVSAALIGLLAPAPGPAGPAGRRGGPGAGLGVIRGDRLLLTLVLVTMAANFLDGPLLSVLLPLYAKQELGSSVALGLLVGTFGAAAAVGALVYGAAHRRLPRRATLIGAFALVGLPFWVLATLPALPWAIAAMAVSGLASGPINPIAATLVQERVAPHLRASVFGAVTAGAMTAVPAGVLVAGYLVEWLGLSTVVTGVAAGYVAVTVALALAPAFRQARSGAPPQLRAACPPPDPRAERDLPAGRT